MGTLEGLFLRPRQVRYQAALRLDCKGFTQNFPLRPWQRAIRARIGQCLLIGGKV
jgi:hypothetical protein